MRKFKQKLQRIDINELFDNSSNRGMLSFLERPPEEAKSRLLEKQRANEVDALRLEPVGDLTPGRDLPPGEPIEFSAVPFPAQSSPTVTPAELDQTLGYSQGKSPLAVLNIYSSEKQRANEVDALRLAPVGDLPPGRDLPPGKPIEFSAVPFPAQSSPTVTPAELDQTLGYPQGKSPLANSDIKAEKTAIDIPVIAELALGVSHPQGRLRTNPAVSSAQIPQAKLPARVTVPEGKSHIGLTGLIDGAIVGRRQKIRRANVAQDGHSSGEQVLYQSLWNAASPESAETRLIAIGYNGMSSLCKLEKSNCKKNIQSLLEKLAVEIIAAYQSATSTGTTYRVFSYKEILRRREAAGLVWVIRTSGVRFVNPVGDLPVPPDGDLHSGPISETPTPPLGEVPRAPVCKTPTHLGKRRTNEGKPSSSVVYQALSKYGTVDDDVCNRLLQACKAQAPNCTDQEIVHFIQEKGSLVRGRENRIYNPLGFLLKAVPKCFAGESFRLYREEEQKRCLEETIRESRRSAEIEEWDREQEARLSDPAVPEEDKQLIRKCLKH